MSKSLTKEQYAKYILSILGGDIVDVELENDIETFIDLALLKVKPYMGSTKLMTLPASTKIDLTDKEVYTVIHVYRGTPISSGMSTEQSKVYSDDTYLFNPGLFNYTNGILNVNSVDSIAITILTNQVVNQAYGRSSDIEFDYDDGILYLELTNAGTTEVTIEYIPDYEDVSEITEPFWINYILNISVALTKIALGRARGKYTLSNLPYSMDADTLLNEGNQELENCMSKLEELNDIYYIED